LARVNQAREFLLADVRGATSLCLERGDNGRSGAAVTLGAAWRFIVLFDRPHAERLHFPLLRLQDALSALENNQVEAIIKPVARIGRATSSSGRAALMGVAAGAGQRLCDAGIGRAEAVSKVAKARTKVGVRPERGRGPVTATTVRHWCNKVAEDVSRAGAAATVYDSMFTAEETARFAALQKDRQAFALKSLVEFVRATFPEIRGAAKTT